MIVFSDLHLKEDTEETVFNDVLPGLLEALATEDDRHLVCLGDFWHLRYQVSVKLQNRALEFFRRCGRLGVTVYLLPGNHDQINVQGENALQVFSELPNVEVFTEPQWTKYGLWIPYRKNLEDVRRALVLPNTNGYPPVVWMHQGVRGALLKAGVKDTKGIDPDEFVNWIAYCGHYHLRQKVGNVQYVGSPYQMRLDDVGLKGYAVVDPTTFKSRFVDTNWGKQYYSVVLSQVEELETRPGDEVRVHIPQGVDAQGVIAGFAEKGVRCIPVKQVEVQEQRLDVRADSDFVDYVKAYVNEFKGNLDGDKLLSMYQGYASLM